MYYAHDWLTEWLPGFLYRGPTCSLCMFTEHVEFLTMWRLHSIQLSMIIRIRPPKKNDRHTHTHGDVTKLIDHSLLGRECLYIYEILIMCIYWAVGCGFCSEQSYVLFTHIGVPLMSFIYRILYVFDYIYFQQSSSQHK